ncbi:GP-1, partial [Ectocarpus fasciculatus virus a]
RIYLESVDGSRGGCASPTTIYEALGDASPLFPLETAGEWMLSESLHVLDGITLNLYGTDVGGDVDYIKLRSDSEMTVSIRAHGGSLDLLNTKVTSWDSSKGDVDTDWSDGRSFLSAISEVVLDTSETCVGSAKNDMGEARMDIENCEIAFLGYEEAESWGISWKLRGVCNDKSNLDMYEGVGVYGNLLGSEVHDLYYGHYGYRQSFALLSRNSVYNNEVYGFDPHDDSVN